MATGRVCVDFAGTQLHNQDLLLLGEPELPFHRLLASVMNLVVNMDFLDIRKLFVVHSKACTVMGVIRKNEMIRSCISTGGGSRQT